MIEYVYALHDFIAENDDEVSFHAGERIEVIEKDDEYGDGWWQGRNLAGAEGLFPRSYTTPAPPTTVPTVSVTDSSNPLSTIPIPSSTLQVLPEEPEPNGQDSRKSNDSRGSRRSASEGEMMMKETMTDVQKAIEQLGSGGDADEGKSFSFRSTKDTDTDTTDGEGDGGDDWHKGARSRLADAVASRSRKAKDDNRGERSVRPPIEVELSDESEDEMEEDRRPVQRYSRDHPRISEEDEDEEHTVSRKRGGSDAFTNHTAGAQQKHEDETTTPSDPARLSSSTQLQEITYIPSHNHLDDRTPTRIPPSTPTSMTTSSTAQEPSSHHASKHSSVSSAVNSGGSLTKKTTNPSEWSVEDVVEWLKGKGFESDVYDKFTEQEITGDVLLELDINLLKSEIGIPAFGKRMRIANAINELRRPPSVVYSDTTSKVGLHTHSQSMHSIKTNSSWNGAGSSPVATTTTYSIPENGNNGVLTTSMSEDGAVGLGITASNGKSKPTPLLQSPSDSNLRAQVMAVMNIPEETDEDRAAASESEAPSQTARRRFFGQPSSLTRERPRSTHSSRASPASSPTKLSPSDQETGAVSLSARNSRGRRSMDSAPKTSERLSLFGASFAGTFGKSRKPPPRYSGVIPNDQDSEKSSLALWRQNRKTSGKSTLGSPKSPKSLASTDKDVDIKREPTLLRRRTNSDGRDRTFLTGESILEQIGVPDHSGWMRKKGDRYNNWKTRFFIIKGSHMYCLKSDSVLETKIKGYINIIGYKVVADENLDPGRYGFRIIHDTDKTHSFSSDDPQIIREWMKAIMKATIARDYTRHVVSSATVPTIPLVVAQAMNPAPRPPSPTARDATQKALLRDNPNQLSSRDARILMGLSSESGPQLKDSERARLNSFFMSEMINNPEPDASTSGPVTPMAPSTVTPTPPRPTRRHSTQSHSREPSIDDGLIEWANGLLPKALRIQDGKIPDAGGLVLLRLAEAIKGQPSSPPVPDSAFPSRPNDDKLDGLFQLFDFLLDNDVKMGSVSINDIRQGKLDKIVQLMRALKVWDDKNRAIEQSLSN